MSLLKKIKKYRRRIRLLSKANQIGSSVRKHRQEYAILGKSMADFLMQNRNKLRKGKIKWHR